MDEQKKWTLRHGCHDGTLVGRDDGYPESFDTREEAIEMYKEHRAFYHSIGYQIWYAELISPDGEKEHLESNPYRR